jgi:hypothetical protein
MRQKAESGEETSGTASRKTKAESVEDIMKSLGA